MLDTPALRAIEPATPVSLLGASRIAVLVPCRNEAPTVATVIAQFRASLPTAVIYVYDNASDDDTCAIAKAAGAVVREVGRPGKGGVVRRMFSEVEADVYVLVDGDATYDASRAPELVALLVENDFDMVTAVREHDDSAAYRRGHAAGNRAFNDLIGMLFGDRPADAFSGYRALSRRFVKSFPMQAQRFEVETEMTVHALELDLPRAELPTRYVARPSGSTSKLDTWRDGARILRYMVRLYRDTRPLAFFSLIALAFALAGLVLGGSVFVEFIRTRQVPRLPSAVLATGLVTLATVSLACGIILDSVARGRLEAKRLAYLALRTVRNS
jgi:glycosyltransferase involved in cell wall biosynthesis